VRGLVPLADEVAALVLRAVARIILA
jgi:hypothetical protein